MALTWALIHWEYLIGKAPVVLRTSHTPVSYIISGQANNGRVSHPRLAKWTLALLNHDIKIEPMKTTSLVPSVLATPISPEQDHECPIPIQVEATIKSPFNLLSKYEDVKNKATHNSWVVDGSCYRHEGSIVTGAAALHASTGRKIQNPVHLPSAQAAEIIAVILALENADTTENLAICTDSDWILRSFIDWMVVWKQQDVH